MMLDDEDAAYLYNTYHSYRKLNDTLLIEDPEVINTILLRFKFYHRLSDAFSFLVSKCFSKSGDASYDIAVLGLYYSLPEFSYCFGERLEDIGIPLFKLTADLPDDILADVPDDAPPFKSNLVKQFRGNLVNSWESISVRQKIDAYFKDLAIAIEKADHQKLSSTIAYMRFSSVPTCIRKGDGGNVWHTLLQFVKRSCAIMKLFEQDKNNKIEFGLKESPMLFQKTIPGSRPNISYKMRDCETEFETIQPFECPTSFMNFALSNFTEENGNNDEEIKNKDSAGELTEELRKYLAVQALASHSNMALISDGISFYATLFDFDADSEGLDIPFTYSSCNLGFTGGITPAQLIHSMVYDRWRSFIGEKQRDGLKTLVQNFGKYRSKYFNFDSVEIYGCSSGKEITDEVKSKYKFNFTIIQDSKGWCLNLVFKLSLDSCKRGFKLNVDRGVLKDEDAEVTVKLLDTEFLKDFLHEEELYPYKEYEEKYLENFEKEIDVYKTIQRHNEENPSKLIHIPKFLGSGNVNTFVDTDTYNMRLLTGPVIVLEYLKGMKHPKSIEECQKAEVEIEMLASLGYKHEDIRAENILYDPVEETAYLLDFQYMSFDENLDPVAVVSDFRKEYVSFLDEN